MFKLLIAACPNGPVRGNAEWLLWRYSDQPSHRAGSWCSISILVRKDDGHAFGVLTIRRAFSKTLGPTCSWVKVPPCNLAKSDATANESLLAALTWHSDVSVQVFRHSAGQEVKWVKIGIAAQGGRPENIGRSITLHVQKCKGVLPKRVESAIESRPPQSLRPALFDKHAKHFNTLQLHLSCS